MSRIASEMIQVYVCRQTDNTPPEFLVLLRADDETLYPGVWQVITGSIEPGESAPCAAKRELFEETGFHTEFLHVVPYVASFYLAETDTVHLVPVFAAIVAVDATPRISNEHMEFRWLPKEEAKQLLAFPSHRDGLDILTTFVLGAGSSGISNTA